jgi:hypothetical protein
VLFGWVLTLMCLSMLVSEGVSEGDGLADVCTECLCFPGIRRRPVTLAGVVLGLALVAVLAWLFVARRRRAQQYHDALLLPTVVSLLH